MSSATVCDLLQLSDKLKSDNLRKINLTEEDLSVAVNIITEWFQTQPHLPDIIPDPGRIICIFISCKGSIQRTKLCLDAFYSLKSVAPEIFSNRDPLNPDIKNASDGVIVAFAPSLTQSGERVACVQCRDPDKFNIINYFKYVYMTLDLRMQYDYGFDCIYIIDLSDLKLGHVTKTTPSLLKLSINASQEAYVARIKAIHLIRAPKYADSLIHFTRTLLKPKIRDRIFMHDTFDDLHKLIDRNILPKDFGGDQKSLDELWHDWYSAALEYRDWFLKEDKYRTDESKRPEKTELNEILGTYGSFRKLNVD